MRYILLCLLGAAIQACFILAEKKKKYVAAVTLKGLASVCFVLLGVFASKCSTDTKFAKLIVIGLILGLVGDVFLNLRFVFEKIGQKIFLLGIAAFLAGHIVYLVALIPLSTHLVFCLALGAVCAIIVLALIFTHIDKVKIAFKIFGVFYIGAVVIMTVVALGNLFSNPRSTQALLYALGAVFFTASDIILIFNTFTSKTKFSMRVMNLSLYYIGQLLIAGSLFFI